MAPGPLAAGQGLPVSLMFAAGKKQKVKAVNFAPFVLAGPGVV